MEQVNYNSGEVLESLNNKLDRDFNNMAVNSVNFAKYSNNVTNCITEIPQDIKLELVDGILTLKAGSKVYVPNGFEADGVTPKFDEVVIESDISNTYTGATFSNLVFVSPTNTLHKPNCNMYSGSTAPSGESYMMWYDTENNSVKYTTDSGSTWVGGYSLPVCSQTTTSGSGTTSIDQVFNGFGYIGSTVFALPNVKGLIPNGRNADGSLKNVEFEITSVLTTTFSNTYTANAVIVINSGIYSALRSSFYWYDAENNYNIQNDGVIAIKQYCIAGTLTTSSGVITTFNPSTVFHTLDWNDSSWIAAQAMPSDKYIDLELGATGTQYTAPANGWFHIAKVPGSADTHITMVNTCVAGNTNQAGNFTIRAQASSNGMTIYLNLPVKKGDVAVINYTASGNTDAFRFIYAEGEN